MGYQLHRLNKRIQNKNLNLWTWLLVPKPLEPVPGKKFHADFESAIKHTKFLQPEGKTFRNTNTVKTSLNQYERTV